MNPILGREVRSHLEVILGATNAYWSKVDSILTLQDDFRYSYQGQLEIDGTPNGKVYLGFPKRHRDGITSYYESNGRPQVVHDHDAQLKLIDLFETALDSYSITDLYSVHRKPDSTGSRFRPDHEIDEEDGHLRMCINSSRKNLGVEYDGFGIRGVERQDTRSFEQIVRDGTTSISWKQIQADEINPIVRHLRIKDASPGQGYIEGFRATVPDRDGGYDIYLVKGDQENPARVIILRTGAPVDVVDEMPIFPDSNLGGRICQRFRADLSQGQVLNMNEDTVKAANSSPEAMGTHSRTMAVLNLVRKYNQDISFLN